jgi:hypothetical protein
MAKSLSFAFPYGSGQCDKSIHRLVGKKSRRSLYHIVIGSPGYGGIGGYGGGGLGGIGGLGGVGGLGGIGYGGLGGIGIGGLGGSQQATICVVAHLKP